MTYVDGQSVAIALAWMGSGEMLLLEFLEPLGLTQVELAHRMGVPFPRINQIVKQKRAVTPDTAMRFAQLLGTTPEFWLNLHQNWSSSRTNSRYDLPSSRGHLAVA